MKEWTEWEIIRRQAAIGGRITDEHNTPVAGAKVAIIKAPQAFKRLIPGSDDKSTTGRNIMDDRPDHTITRLDGIYYFLDLPAGQYTLNVTDSRSGKHDQKSVSVSKDKEHNIKMMPADFKLSV